VDLITLHSQASIVIQSSCCFVGTDSVVTVRRDLQPKPLNHNPISKTQVELLDPSIFSILTIWFEKMGEFVLEVDVVLVHFFPEIWEK